MIEIKNLSKIYHTVNGDIKAVMDVSLTVENGDIFGIIGLSGAGKSTLVRCINFLEVPTSGSVILDGTALETLNAEGLRKARKKMSMIFQGFNLLSQRTALRNVMYPLEISGMKKANAVAKAKKLLALVGLSDRENSYPSQLSGGQKQRVAIARALATDPAVLLCDEATSALDPNTTRQVLDLLKQINKQLGVTIIVITHEMKVIEKICNKVAVIDNSHIVEQGLVKDVFLSPKSEIARQLILPGRETVGDQTQKSIRIVFDSDTAFEPIVSDMALRCGVSLNILSANLKNFEGHAYGQMILELPSSPEDERKIRSYLDDLHIPYTEGGIHE